MCQLKIFITFLFLNITMHIIDIIAKHNCNSNKALLECQLDETKVNMILATCFRTVRLIIHQQQGCMLQLSR